MSNAAHGNTYKRFLISVTLLLCLNACAVQYVSRYDEITEQSITRIQRNVEGLLQRVGQSLGTPEAEYGEHAATYEQLNVDVALLNTRAQAIELNSITVEQSGLLLAWLENLETLHRSGIDDAGVLAVVGQQARQIFVAMLKFELAKKRQLQPAHIEENERS